MAGLASYLQRVGNFPVYRNSGAAYYPIGEEAFEAILAELQRAPSAFHICRNMRVKVRTASPVIRMATSFQWPWGWVRLIYSSARLMWM